jgi:ankyrin repeat protein
LKLNQSKKPKVKKMGNINHTIHAAAVISRSPKYKQRKHGLIREAICLNDRRTLEILIKSTNRPLLADNQAKNPFHYAGECGSSPDLINLLYSIPNSMSAINEQDNLGNTPLHEAVRRGRMETIQCMIRHGAYFSVNIRNSQMATPLMLELRKPFVSAQVVDFLLRNGARSTINSQDINGDTAMHLAAKNGDVQIIHKLLDHGGHASINLMEYREGNTPLHVAAVFGHQDIVYALLNAGADALVENRKGESAIQLIHDFTIQKIRQSSSSSMSNELTEEEDHHNDPNIIRIKH